MWSGFRKFSREIIPRIDNERKLIGMLIGVASVGFTIGMATRYLELPYPTSVSAQGSTTKMARSIDSCDALLEKLPKIQAAYGRQLQPLQMRWLEITKELESGGLLSVERQNKIEVEKMIQLEIDKLQNQHKEIVSDLSAGCKN